jgi:hypothetical protein
MTEYSASHYERLRGENARLRAQVAAADLLAAACETFRLEMENPVPDAIYRDMLRRNIFKLTAVYLASKQP